MAQLHELLAAEKTVVNARDRLTEDTENKFGKGDNYFGGFTKTLELFGDDTTNAKLEAAARQDKELTTTVTETMDYFLNYWVKAEDVLYQKNATNTTAVANLMYKGVAIAEGVPVDELMGLEVRLTQLRKLATQIPTLDSSKAWVPDFNASQRGTWKAVQPTVTTKTEKVTIPVVLYPATEQHAAQVKESSIDKVIGAFTTHHTSGATTALQKANVIAILDELIVESKAARTRANSVPIVTVDPLATKIKDLIMAPLFSAPLNNQV